MIHITILGLVITVTHSDMVADCSLPALSWPPKVLLKILRQFSKSASLQRQYLEASPLSH